MKILILSLADANFAEVGAISGPNKQAYAERHGYTFIQEGQLLNYDRHPSWNKILWVINHLPYYDWVFWSDADSLIMNDKIWLEDIILDTGEDLIITQDENGLNCGQFFARKSFWTIEFLEKVWAQDQFIDHQWWEQAAITHLLQTVPEYRSHVRLADQRLFNSYVTPYVYTYLPGDFLIHFVGLANEKWNLIGLMRKYAYNEPFKCYDAAGTPLAGREGALPDC
jgi:hypothetical protein